MTGNNAAADGVSTFSMPARLGLYAQHVPDCITRLCNKPLLYVIFREKKSTEIVNACQDYFSFETWLQNTYFLQFLDFRL